MPYLILAGKLITNYYFENFVIHSGTVTIYMIMNSNKSRNDLLSESNSYKNFLEAIIEYRNESINYFAIHNPVDHFIEIYEYSIDLLNKSIALSIFFHASAHFLPGIDLFHVDIKNKCFEIYENLHTGMHFNELFSSAHKLNILDIPKIPTQAMENSMLNYFFSYIKNVTLFSQCDFEFSPTSLPDSKLEIKGVEFNLLIFDFDITSKLPLSLSEIEGVEFHNVSLLGTNSLEVRVFSHNWQNEEHKTLVLHDANIDFENALDNFIFHQMVGNVSFCY